VGKLSITTGRQPGAVKAVIYGTEGIGKSTLAAQFPGALIIDTEDGSRHIDCARCTCHDWKSLVAAMAELVADSNGFKTVVIDSADWAEKMLVEQLLDGSGKKSIEDFGFGKGYVMLAERVSRFLSQADALAYSGVNVVFVAHSQVRRISPPDQTDGYDRYELKLAKQTAPLFKEWADLVLFCNYKTRLVEGSDGRIKAHGGKARVMYAERSAAWDAKNRFGLPEEMPMEFEQLASIFASPAPAAADALLFQQVRDYIAAATNVRTLGKIADRIDELSSDGQLTIDQADELRKKIDQRHDVIEPATTKGAS
jgi:hypothetical protein